MGTQAAVGVALSADLPSPFPVKQALSSLTFPSLTIYIYPCQVVANTPTTADLKQENNQLKVLLATELEQESIRLKAVLVTGAARVRGRHAPAPTDSGPGGNAEAMSEARLPAAALRRSAAALQRLAGA